VTRKRNSRAIEKSPERRLGAFGVLRLGYVRRLPVSVRARRRFFIGARRPFQPLGAVDFFQPPQLDLSFFILREQAALLAGLLELCGELELLRN
jgi:hypothetical protein